MSFDFFFNRSSPQIICDAGLAPSTVQCSESQCSVFHVQTRVFRSEHPSERFGRARPSERFGHPSARAAFLNGRRASHAGGWVIKKVIPETGPPWRAEPPRSRKLFFNLGFDFCRVLFEIGCVPEHPLEALVAAIGSGSLLRFGFTERELWCSNLSPV